MSEPIRDIIFEAVEASLEAQLNAIRRLRSKSADATKPKAARGKSQISMVYDVLAEAKKPLHLSAIIELVQTQFGVQLDPDSIGSALTKRVVKKDLFARPAKNTFALREADDAG
jgi:HB1, ASXL, restriction endonuclease HTH domain